MENGTLAATGFYGEPPLSPAPAHGPAPAAAEPGPPLERLLLQYGLITSEQLADAMREESATDKPIWTIVVERGWVRREDLVKLAQGAAPDPAPEPSPALAVVAPSETEPAFRVTLRLVNGERIEAHVCDGAAVARERAAEIVRGLAAASETWPCFGGRFVRPDAIVSVEVEAAL